jgi:hypothetical protein
MPRRALDRIRTAIRHGAYDITAHAIEEMAEDSLDIIDVETPILNGRLIRTARDDPRGIRYTVHGVGADATTLVGIIGRFTGTGRYLIITAYEITEPEI